MSVESERIEAARASLASVGEAHGKLADLQAHACPPWRHVAFGVCEALVMLGASVQGWPTFAFYAVAIGLAVILMRRDRRRTGTWTNGFRRGRTLPLALFFAATIAGLVVLAAQDVGEPFPTASGLIAALCALVAGTLASVWWQRIYVAELRDRAAR